MKIYQVWWDEGYGDDVYFATYADPTEADKHLRALNLMKYGNENIDADYCVKEYDVEDKYIPGISAL